jgi:hypothetical protein
MQKIVEDLEIIIGEAGKSVAALQNIFSFEKIIIWMIQIIVGTIWIIVRADQKVISASPITFCLRTRLLGCVKNSKFGEYCYRDRISQKSAKSQDVHTSFSYLSLYKITRFLIKRFDRDQRVNAGEASHKYPKVFHCVKTRKSTPLK